MSIADGLNFNCRDRNLHTPVSVQSIMGGYEYFHICILNTKDEIDFIYYLN